MKGLIILIMAFMLPIIPQANRASVTKPYVRHDIDILVDTLRSRDTEVKETNIPRTAMTLEEDIIDIPYSDYEIELISHLVVAEAEGQPEEGQRYVVDVVLNRVSSSSWPNTVEGVIFAPGQFSCISDGRWDRTSSNQTIKKIVLDEIIKQQNEEIIYFRAEHYGDGDPAFVCGDHYFSK